MRYTAPLLFAIAATAAADPRPESWYQHRWCAEHNGETEVVLEDRTRVDCLTGKYAVEVDFGPKWAQAVGQAMHYAETTGKAPGVVLVVEKIGNRYEERIRRVIEGRGLGIRLWVITEN